MTEVLSQLLSDNTSLGTLVGSCFENKIEVVVDIAFPTLTGIAKDKKTDATQQLFLNRSSDYYCVLIIGNTEVLLYEVNCHIIPYILQQSIITCC